MFGDVVSYSLYSILQLLKEKNPRLTADAWVSGPDLAPQKCLLSQKFRHFMRRKKYLEKFLLILSKKLSKIKKFSRYFLHLMRCLNFWDNKNFWGAKSIPPSPATSVNIQGTMDILGNACNQVNTEHWNKETNAFVYEQSKISPIYYYK